MSDYYEYSKIFTTSDEYNYEDEDDEVFEADPPKSVTSTEDSSTRGITIPSRIRRISDVIDSFTGSESPTSPNFKRNSYPEFPFSSSTSSTSKKTTTKHFLLKESKSESDSMNQRMSMSDTMESCSNQMSLPSTPDQGYGSCLPTPTQTVFKTDRIFRYSSSTFETHQIVSQTDAQPTEIVQEMPAEIPRHDSDIEVPMPVAKDSIEYNMNHARRGRFVVFNHDAFTDESMTPRLGSQTDVKNLQDVFEGLGFDVSVYNNPTMSDIVQILHNLSLEDHSDADCLVITVLTHGLGERYLWAYDMPYFVEKLWLPFTADKCKTLAGKPKIFFVQACRGTKLDGGVRLVSSGSRSNTETDSAANSYKIPSYADFLIAYSTVEDEKMSKNELESELVEDRLSIRGKRHTYLVPKHTPYKIPTLADFLIAYSTAEGFYSWRHPENGTWFIQCLCQELADSGSKLDLLSIMTRVSRRVALDKESYNDLLSWQHQQKQVPSINSMLIRDVIFKPKAIGGCSLVINNNK